MLRLEKAIAGIDAANACDPNQAVVDGVPHPAERLYGQRMSARLGDIAPEASELLQIAVRAQHIRRWQVPRASYEEGRAGYHRWRNDLKRLHAEWAGEIMQGAGYGAGDVDRVGALIRKENLKSDPEAQMLEDVACLVFLEHYAGDFSAKHDDVKLRTILAKTWAKMSKRAQGEALRLPLPPRLADLVAAMVEAGAGSGGSGS